MLLTKLISLLDFRKFLNGLLINEFCLFLSDSNIE